MNEDQVGKSATILSKISIGILLTLIVLTVVAFTLDGFFGIFFTAYIAPVFMFIAFCNALIAVILKKDNDTKSILIVNILGLVIFAIIPWLFFTGSIKLWSNT